MINFLQRNDLNMDLTLRPFLDFYLLEDSTLQQSWSLLILSKNRKILVKMNPLRAESCFTHILRNSK
jgi:hypothetical protein